MNAFPVGSTEEYGAIPDGAARMSSNRNVMETTLAFPASETSPISFGEGAFALQHILEHGGSGYLPLRSIRAHLENGRLFVVNGAPEFTRAVYLARSLYLAEADWLFDASNALAGLGQHIADLELDTLDFKAS